MNGVARLPLVLLPGTLCDQRVWQAHVHALGRRRVVITPALGLAPTLQDEARRLLACLPPRFALGGFSLGAMLAFEIVRQAGTRVAGLCIVSSSARQDPPHNAPTRLAQLMRFRRGDLDGLLEQELLPAYFAPRASIDQRKGWRELILAMAQATRVGAFENQVAYALSRPDSLATLAAMRVPVQVQCGQDDLLCGPARHEEMASVLDDGALVRIPDCGHFLPIEASRSSIISMEKWLDSIENGRPERAA